MEEIKHFCSDCGKEEFFKTITIEETLKIKGVSVTNTHEYIECLSCGELFEPFEDPEKNLLSDYRIYRDIKGFIQPEEIKAIRDNYKMTLRVFSKITGISYSTLSNIENNSIHNKEHDTIFRLAQDPYSFKKLVQQRKLYLEETEFNQLIKRLEVLCLVSYEEHKHLIVEFRNDLTRRINTIEFDVKSLQNKTGREKEGEVQWNLGLKKTILGFKS